MALTVDQHKKHTIGNSQLLMHFKVQILQFRWHFKSLVLLLFCKKNGLCSKIRNVADDDDRFIRKLRKAVRNSYALGQASFVLETYSYGPREDGDIFKRHVSKES